MDTESDTQTTEQVQDTSQSGAPSGDTQEAPGSEGSPAQTSSPGKAAPYVPFSNGGKEKFKVSGQEHEWDWETTKRYAQIGRSGHQAMERAAAVEKKARETYGGLIQNAKTDPEGLIRILRNEPNWTPKGSKATPESGARTTEDGGEGGEGQDDPRDAQIQDLRARLERFEQKAEQADVETERAAIDKEMDAARKAYPELDDEITMEYVRGQYRRALMSHDGNGDPLTVDDVAFHVAQQIKEKRAQKNREKTSVVDANREKAPLGGAPRGGKGSAGDKPMNFNDVRKLAGLPPA